MDEFGIVITNLAVQQFILLATKHGVKNDSFIFKSSFQH
jgi:hypothetical protein